MAIPGDVEPSDLILIPGNTYSLSELFDYTPGSGDIFTYERVTIGANGVPGVYSVTGPGEPTYYNAYEGFWSYPPDWGRPDGNTYTGWAQTSEIFITIDANYTSNTDTFRLWGSWQSAWWDYNSEGIPNISTNYYYSTYWTWAIDTKPATVSIKPPINVVNEDMGSYAIFPVLLSQQLDYPVSVNYATKPGSATPGEDYETAGGTVHFEPGQTVSYIRIPIVDDSAPEQDEKMSVHLFGPSASGGAAPTITTASAEATIVDDDRVAISIADAAPVREGNAGTTAMTFEVTLDQPADYTVTIDWEALGLTATSGVDFRAAAGTLVFNKGETAKTITVDIIGDTDMEPNQSLQVVLSNPQGPSGYVPEIARGQAAGVILDDGDTGCDGLTYDEASSLLIQKRAHLEGQYELITENEAMIQNFTLENYALAAQYGGAVVRDAALFGATLLTGPLRNVAKIIGADRVLIKDIPKITKMVEDFGEITVTLISLTQTYMSADAENRDMIWEKMQGALSGLNTIATNLTELRLLKAIGLVDSIYSLTNSIGDAMLDGWDQISDNLRTIDDLKLQIDDARERIPVLQAEIANLVDCLEDYDATADVSALHVNALAVTALAAEQFQERIDSDELDFMQVPGDKQHDAEHDAEPADWIAILREVAATPGGNDRDDPEACGCPSKGELEKAAFMNNELRDWQADLMLA